jgi:hypothetical protein
MSEKKDNLENSQQNQDPNYWRSFEELYANKDFLKEKDNEFKEGVSV